MAERPRYSVVIPTRNRAFTLGTAIQCVLDQTVGDFELIVSNNNSTDDTAELVRGYDDDRIRYFETGRDLSMIDSWEFAVGQATGEWVTILADDDVNSAHLLAEVERARDLTGLEIVAWNDMPYYPDDPTFTALYGRANEFVWYPVDGGVRVTSSRDALDDVFRFRGAAHVPRGYNSCCHRSVLDRVRGRLGRLFFAPAPDFTLGIAMLALYPSYAYIDKRLTLRGLSYNNPHASPASFQNFANEMTHHNPAAHAPIPVLSPVNQVLESVYRIRSLMPEELADAPDDLLDYVRGFFLGILRHRSLGFSMEMEARLLSDFVAGQPAEFRSRARRLMRTMAAKHYVDSRLKAILFRTGLAPLAARLRGVRLVRGAEHGFNDILGAARYSDSLQFGEAPADAAGSRRASVSGTS
jgi:glycosyltransferase involved in cell wall biosynthesis